ncbi:TPA: hypothetical protein N0F65_007071 [Lagenidium giganteum]|uniref:PiggyBac transposable element-derived protein domain-containing protein n=1 Tax=Lagenidium giganteum TaxID=4803 RepID=A0AAV2YRS6_9STRA|nr:TPA: hypothetical protein N0F65_007071 [Lagenidium giganteum]
MIPNRSRYNPMKVYMKDKPNKWGTNCYTTCCAQTAYCASSKPDQPQAHAGPTAVVRNVSKVLSGQPMKRLVVTDNFYSSVALSIKLLNMGLYHVGIVRVNRLGWCKEVSYTQKTRPRNVVRGSYRIARNIQHPELVALSWMDSRPVNFLATGCSTKLTQVRRRERDGSRTDVPCPQLVVQYHRGIGGVDVHDQLRLQRYSVQLVDMALVNGYIVHKLVVQDNGGDPPTHAAYMRSLHADLLGLDANDFTRNLIAEDLGTGPCKRSSHESENTQEMYRNKRHHIDAKCALHSLRRILRHSRPASFAQHVHRRRVAVYRSATRRVEEN